MRVFEILQGTSKDDKYSSKRVIAFLLTATIIMLAVGSTYFGLEVKEFIFQGLITVLIWSLGFVGSEQFAGMLQRPGDTGSMGPMGPKGDPCPEP